MLNQQQRKDLNLRDGVSIGMLGLLSRATGLDLLGPADYVEQHTEYRELHGRLGVDETFQGFDFGACDPDSSTLRQVVLVTNGINYPEPGYPEAYPFESVFDWS